MALSDQTENLAAIAKWGKLIPAHYDHVKTTYPNATTEVYTFRQGGAAGLVVSIVTIVYTDSTKEDLDTVDRT